MKRLFSILLSSLLISEEIPWQSEGIFSYPSEMEMKIDILARYLPYNPHVIGLGCGDEEERKSRSQWPHGAFFSADPVELDNGLKCDLLWVKSEGAELCYLQKGAALLEKAKVVYTTTHFYHKGAYYLNLKGFLERSGFTLRSHWFKKGEEGEAIFVRNDIFWASINSINYSPPSSVAGSAGPLLDMEKFLRPALNKSTSHTMEGIDFIYMINLDERPEKFAQAAAELLQYTIIPYRFSAVNGWKLSPKIFEELGVKFAPGMLKESFMGITYKEIEGCVCPSNELLQENSNTYFHFGMSQGSIGIILSHLSILKDAYDSGYETIWVMEDDVEAIEDPRQLSDLIRLLDEQVTEWDILFTDTDSKDKQGVHVPCRALAARPNLSMQPIASFYERFKYVSPQFSQIGMRYGAYSMIIRRSAMKKILDFFRTYRIYLPYDFDFWLVPDIKLYCTNKDIVSHRAGAHSDNSKPLYNR